MSNKELQEEEREVLSSIYDCDNCFKQSSDNSFTYRVGEAGKPKSFMVEITWGESYPDVLPTITLDAFFNKHLSSRSKSSIIKILGDEGQGLLGSPMTYSLFELAKERAEEMVPDREPTASEVVVKKKERKEILTKNQKRKLADRLSNYKYPPKFVTLGPDILSLAFIEDAQGERERGWNWVDVIKLSKTGGVVN